ncbi:PRKR-interacting protein 1-like [Salvia divinorum]|uniref:PRKR-interacting protein 1-like n=1 Tax=Salvia divinorum TaxID=28513 RepID=A0ABD1IAI6_SALDI
MTSSGRPTSAAAGDLQMVLVADRSPATLPPRPLPPSSSSSALVEYTPPAANPEDEDLEVKLRRIIECVPVRVSNTSGSSAGSGSGDFHQYRQMRRKEQDRLARMDADFQKRRQITEFAQRREERLKAAEERTAKKRLKRLKKKLKKKDKKCKTDAGGDEHKKEPSSDEGGDSDSKEA